MSIHFAGSRSGFSCKMKSVEGTIHDRTRLVPEGAMFSKGVGAICAVQMPPSSDVANILAPSAEQATPVHCATGALFDIQVSPESTEV